MPQRMSLRPRKGTKIKQPIESQPVAAIPSLSAQYDARINANIVETHRICEETRRLREERNETCSSTRKLPVELLSMIFRSLSSSSIRLKSWISITYVCHKWRVIALDEPYLWTNLFGLTGPWLERSLDLAKTAPLSVHYVVPHNEDSDTSSDSSGHSDVTEVANPVIEGLLNTPERLGCLKIVGGSTELLSRINKPAPNLTSLMLHGSAFSIPKNFIGGDAPRLVYFSLGTGSVPSGMPWFVNLRQLCLVNTWGVTSQDGKHTRITVPSFVEFIRPLQALEEVNIDFHSYAKNPSQYRGPSVRFPHLRRARFSFINATIYMLDFLKHIEIPSVRDLHISWPWAFCDTGELKDVYDLYVKNAGVRLTQIKWPPTLFKYRGADITLTSDAAGYNLIFNCVVVNPSTGMPFEDLATIEELELHSPALLNTIIASQSNSCPPYPSLTHLRLAALTLRPKTKMIPQIKQWLKARATTTRRIERLTILGSDITEKDIRSLEKCIPVKWIRDSVTTPDTPTRNIGGRLSSPR